MTNNRERFFEKDAKYKNFKMINLSEDFVKNFQDKVDNSDRVTEEEIIEAFSFPWYNTIDFGNGFIHDGNFKMDSHFSKYNFPDLKEKRAIDLGSNEGIFSFEMERLGAKEVVACELFEHNITRMRFLKKLRDSKIRIEQLDMFSSNFDFLGKFDIVLCSHVIGHVGPENPINNVKKQDLLELCWNLCNIGGTIILVSSIKKDGPLIQEFFKNEDCKKISSFNIRSHSARSQGPSNIFHIKKLDNILKKKK